jgi:hypothetical protein
MVRIDRSRTRCEALQRDPKKRVPVSPEDHAHSAARPRFLGQLFLDRPDADLIFSILSAMPIIMQLNLW